MPTEVHVPEESRKEYLDSLKAQLSPEEVSKIERRIDEKAELIRHPRNRLARRIHQFARWVEFYRFERS